MLTDWYLPAYKAGGPVRSVAALAYHMRERFNFFVITSNKDAFDRKPLPVKTEEWIEGPYGEKIMYVESCDRPKLKRILEQIRYDFLYLNSFFSKSFSIDPLILRKKGELQAPLILAPRGMLREAALAIKPLKKKLFINLSRLRGLHEGIRWHATSAEEALDIKKVYGEHVDVITASNLTLPPVRGRTDYSKVKGELKVCSVTRIVPNKKIDFAIEVLKEVEAQRIVYDVYGPAENLAYYEKCRRLVIDLPDHITVNFKGAVRPGDVETVLKEHHVFLLPTETENYGHAIVEAMLNGCVPVISEGTPWRDLAKAGAGWDISLQNRQEFVQILQFLTGMDQSAFESQSIRTQSYMFQRISDINTLRAYEQLFK